MKMFNEAGQAALLQPGYEEWSGAVRGEGSGWSAYYGALTVRSIAPGRSPSCTRRRRSSGGLGIGARAERFGVIPGGLDLRGFFFCPLLFSTGKNFICAAFWCLDLELYRLHIKMRWLASLWPAELRKEKGRRASPRWGFRCPFCGYGAKSAALVLAPTLPSTVRLRLSWNCFTAAVVFAPNRPSGSPGVKAEGGEPGLPG